MFNLNIFLFLSIFRKSYSKRMVNGFYKYILSSPITCFILFWRNILFRICKIYFISVFTEDGSEDTIKVEYSGYIVIYRKKLTKKKENNPSFVDMFKWDKITSKLQSIVSVIVDATDTNYYQITMPNLKILRILFYSISYYLQMKLHCNHFGHFRENSLLMVY